MIIPSWYAVYTESGLMDIEHGTNESCADAISLVVVVYVFLAFTAAEFVFAGGGIDHSGESHCRGLFLS